MEHSAQLASGIREPRYPALMAPGFTVSLSLSGGIFIPVFREMVSSLNFITLRNVQNLNLYACQVFEFYMNTVITWQRTVFGSHLMKWKFSNMGIFHPILWSVLYFGALVSIVLLSLLCLF